MKRATWAVLLAAGCSTAAPTAPEAPAPTEAPGPEEARILEELRREPVPADAHARSSQRHYELALAYFNKSDFEKAKVEAREAVRLHPENLAARKLLAQIHEIVAGSPPGGIFEHDVRHAIVGVEQAQVEIANHMVHGERFFNARMYDRAIREFESALLKLQFIPADVKTMNELRPKAKEMLLRSKNARR